MLGMVDILYDGHIEFTVNTWVTNYKGFVLGQFSVTWYLHMGSN